MDNLVYKGQNDQAITNSLLVAKKFGKEHKHVLDSIRDLIVSAEKSAQTEGQRVSRMFALAEYETPLNNGTNAVKKSPMFIMNRDGFTLLAMGFTGTKALQFKMEFLGAFNKMESLLNSDDYILMRSQQILQKRVEEAEQKVKALEADNQQKDAKIAKLQPKADFADAAFITDDKVDIGMAAKILKLGFGRNTLFQKPRQVGVFFSNRNEPKQRFVNAGYFEMKEKFIERNSHPGFVVTKILVTQKGLAYINHLFGGNPSDGKIAAIE